MANMSDNAAKNESRPLPDPTTLTTQQLDKAVTCLREVIEARIDGMDTAIRLLQTGTDKYPSFVKCEVKQLQDLHEEKFASVHIQFLERDERTKKTQEDSKLAIDAAFQAAKLAVDKTELSFTKQIDSQAALLTTATDGIGDKIDDVKDRLTAIESRTKGAGDLWGFIVGAMGLIIAVVTVILVVVRQ